MRQSCRQFFAKKYVLSDWKRPLLGLFLLEVVVLSVWTLSQPLYHAERGFIIKKGKSYVVLWQSDDKELDSVVTESLQDALSFARKDLHLEVASSTLSVHPLESAWVEPRLGNFALYWKTFDSQFLNRLTFIKRADAESYYSYFKQGAYSPSPLGHSIALTPMIP